MDALVDLTETGETLRRNGLRIVETLLTSTTRSLATGKTWSDPVKRREIEEIKTLLLGVISARPGAAVDERLRDRLDAVVAGSRDEAPTVNRALRGGLPRGHDRRRQSSSTC